MAKFAVINKEHHLTSKCRRLPDHRFAARETTVPIVGDELIRAVPAMPIVFIEENGKFTLSALLSVTPGQNLFVAPDGRWLGSYVPAGIRTYPFRLANPEGAEQSVLCVDAEYVVSADDPSPGMAFFEADGTPTTIVQQNLDYLTALERSRRTTELAVSALAQAGLIKPWPLTIKSEQHGDRTVNGIFCIDEAALNGLANEDFLKLRATGALPLAYAQLLSMGQIAIFEHLVRMQTQLAPQPLTPLPDSLDHLFDQTNNLEIKFD
jgi:hypothetical protein